MVTGVDTCLIGIEWLWRLDDGAKKSTKPATPQVAEKPLEELKIPEEFILSGRNQTAAYGGNKPFPASRMCRNPAFRFQIS